MEDVLDVTDKINPTIPSAVNRDLLYASGEVAIGSAPINVIATNPIKINFKHMTSRIGVVLNAQGMFAGLNSGKLQIEQSFFEIATLNLKAGTMGNSASAPAGLVTNLISKKMYKVAMLDTAKVGYFYTSSNAKTFTNFKVTLTDFELRLDDGSNRAFTSLKSVFTFPEVTPIIGGGKLLKIDLIESSLTVGATKWARANLFWTGRTSPASLVASAPGAYVFRHFPDRRYTTALGGEFWDYGTAKAGMTKPSVLLLSIPAIDPCANVYPKGIWRMPTEAESLTLVKIAGVPNGGGTTGGAANGTTFGTDYIEYTAAGTAAPYPGNRLRFSFKGFAGGGGGAPSSNVGAIMHFWNSSFFATRNNATVYNAGTAQFNYALGRFKNGDGKDVAQPTPENALTGYVLQAGISSAQSGAANIRCVRNGSSIIIGP